MADNLNIQLELTNNEVIEIDSVLYIQHEFKREGDYTLQSFIDSTTGEEADRYFYKEFRYSSDGGNTYSNWVELTDVNLAREFSVYPGYTELYEFSYTKKGTDNITPIYFDSLILFGSFIDNAPKEIKIRSIDVVFNTIFGGLEKKS